MTQTCTVVVGAADRLPQLKMRVDDGSSELLDFLDGEALRALETIVTRRPKVIALERLFAASPRGAALINRIKADKKLLDAEIRVLAHDNDYMRVVPRPQAAAAHAVDQRGTRRAPRFKIAPKVTALVDGKHATLVDLSTIGAQIVSPAALKPNQMVPMVLSDEVAVVKFTAAVAWTSFEIPPNSGPRYRAGVEFIEADAAAVDAYCARHRA
jgi:hypothetical protein